jgi:hypothetical protein
MTRELVTLYLGLLIGLGWPRLYGPIYPLVEPVEALVFVSIVFALLLISY